MTDDQKSMATQANMDQSEEGYYSEEAASQLQHPSDIQSDASLQSGEESLPMTPHDTSPDISFEGSPSPGDISCEMTFNSPPSDEGGSHDLCPNCLHHMQTVQPPGADNKKQLYIEARLKIFEAAKEHREWQGRGRKAQRRKATSGQQGEQEEGRSASSGARRRVNMREGMRKLWKNRKQCREREPSVGGSEPETSPTHTNNSTFYAPL